MIHVQYDFFSPFQNCFDFFLFYCCNSVKEFILVTPNKRKISNSPKKPIGRDRPIVAPQIDVTLENEMMTPPKPFNPPLHDMMTTYDIEAQLQKKMEEYNQMVILDEQLLVSIYHSLFFPLSISL